MISVLKWVGGFLLLGGAAGLAWAWLADPAEWEVTTRGMVLDEQAARGRFGVIVTFVLIGIVVALVWGLAAGFVLHELGWLLVPVFALAAVAAALLAWRVGIIAGPPDPKTVTGAGVGDKIPQQLAVDAIAPFVVWPIFALVGLFVAVYSAGDRGDEGIGHRDEIGGSQPEVESAPTA